MRTAARIDANQPAIVKALRRSGATVLITSRLKNCFDILVGFQGVNYIMELKDPNQPKSKRKLTEGEQKFKETWRGGPYHVVETIEQAIQIINEKQKI